ncbi:hydroxysqualene dehydroxylase HpnE [Streptomyces oceani]|uniref:Phytoene dehydrogenase n=1 Tax=Streptomyces oceani TaxID=1075402 RepID=A0A1E7KJ09_9ACTN|nr:hydroxysqualene dehydroxylase HpnE [Streptomyces oceani]OEV03948.1 phytoene dehydrogenase [Streptomyces oceani]
MAPDPTPSATGVLVVGGGLAGTTAALRLADAGLPVTLLESRARLGGLASSFHRESPTGPLTVDNGQHVHLRCCTAYQWFLERVTGDAATGGPARLDVPVLDARTGRLGRLRRTDLPAPFHLGAALATYPHLSGPERLAAARAALALRHLDPSDPGLDELDFATWLRHHGQSARAVSALWELIGLPTLNARAADTSLALAAMVFRTGLLSSRRAADLAVPPVPLGQGHDVLARAALDKAGVRTVLGTRIRELTPLPGGGWRLGSTRGPDPGEALHARDVVLAVPPAEAHRLLPEGALARPDRLQRIEHAPILNLHVVYDRRVLRRPFFTALGSPVQWVFDRTGPSGLTGGGQYLALSQSAAHDEIDEPVGVLRDRYLPELARLLPAARRASVRDFFVTRERTATFAPRPGVGGLRPGSRTERPGVLLAGAWTDTGWPATMESAVRSGLTAAREVLDTSGRSYGDEPPYGKNRRAAAA